MISDLTRQSTLKKNIFLQWRVWQKKSLALGMFWRARGAPRGRRGFTIAQLDLIAQIQ